MNSFGPWVLLVMSSTMYAFSLMYSSLCWWMNLLSLVPLFYGAAIYSYRFLHGFIWGFIIFALQGAPFLYALYDMAHADVWVASIGPVSILIYSALIAAVWFECMYRICVVTKFWPSQSAMLWGLSFVAYIYVIEHYFFIPLDGGGGYCFINPLLPLVAAPLWLRVVSCCGIYFTISLQVAISLSITFILLRATSAKLLCGGLTIFLLAVCGFQCPPQIIPAWVFKVARVQSIYPRQANDVSLLTAVADDVASVVQATGKDIIIFPESAIYADFFTVGMCYSLLAKEKIGKHVQIVCGVRRIESNCAYHISGGKAVNVHKKAIFVPLVEYMPSICAGSKVLKDAYCRQAEYMQKMAPVDKSLFMLAKDISVVPFICSEFFFAPYDYYSRNNHPLLVLVNDAWCSDMGKRMLRAVAQLKARAWVADILYVSFSCVLWIDKNGTTTQL